MHYHFFFYFICFFTTSRYHLFLSLSKTCSFAFIILLSETSLSFSFEYSYFIPYISLFLRSSSSSFSEAMEGEFPRAISLFRTSQSYIAQARQSVPSMLAMVWFGLYAPGGDAIENKVKKIERE